VQINSLSPFLTLLVVQSEKVVSHMLMCMYVWMYWQQDASSLKDYLRIRSLLLAQRYGAPALSEQR